MSSTLVPESWIARIVSRTKVTSFGERPEGGLVEHEEPRRRHQGAGHGEHLLLAAGKQSRGLVATLGQPGKELEQLLAVGAQFGAADSRAAHLEVLDDGHRAEDPTPLERLGDPVPHDPARRAVRQGFPEAGYRSGCDGPALHGKKPCDRARQRGFAGPVQSHEGHHLAVADGEVHVVESRDRAAVAHAQVRHVERVVFARAVLVRRHAGGPPRPSARSASAADRISPVSGNLRLRSRVSADSVLRTGKGACRGFSVQTRCVRSARARRSACSSRACPRRCTSPRRPRRSGRRRGRAGCRCHPSSPARGRPTRAVGRRR